MFLVDNYLFFVIRREGTTQEEDSLAKDDIVHDVGSGSDAESNEASQAIRLAENLALIPLPLNQQVGREEAKNRMGKDVIRRVNYKPSNENVKRANIPYPNDDALLMKMRRKLSNNNITVTVKYGDTLNTNMSYKRNLAIDEDIIKRVENDYRIKPKLGMYLRCDIPGNTGIIEGMMRYLGIIRNLPNRRYDIIAGLQLDSASDRGTDGTFLGRRYFTTLPKRGYFVPFKYCAPENN